MPTRRPRHTLTETDELERALDIAARRWPEDRGRRTRLLMRVVRDWARGQDEEKERHRAALESTRGSMTGVFPKGYLEELRNEWPE